MNIVRQLELLPRCGIVLRTLGRVFCVWGLLVVSSVAVCEAAILNQAHFENEKLAPWEIFVTQNGTMGGVGWPTVVPFETRKDGQESKSLQFKVGQKHYDPDKEAEQGGGLVAQIPTESGTLNLSAYVAVSYHSPALKDRRNLAGGRFQWIVDDQIIATHDSGPIENDGIHRHHLHVHHPVSSGVHTIRLRITRPFASRPEQHAPFQYVDDLLIQFSPDR